MYKYRMIQTRTYSENNLGYRLNNSLEVEKKINFTQGINTIEKFIFYDQNLEEIELLIQGALSNYKYIPISKRDNLFQVINFYLNKKEKVDVSILCHGSNKGIFIGNEFINSQTIRKYSAYIENLNINKFSIFSCNAGQNKNLINGFSEILNCDVFASSNLIGHSSKNANWDLDVCSDFNKSSQNIDVPFNNRALVNWKHSLIVALNNLAVDSYIIATDDKSVNDSIMVTGTITAAQAASLVGKFINNNIGSGQYLSAYIQSTSGLSQTILNNNYLSSTEQIIHAENQIHRGSNIVDDYISTTDDESVNDSIMVTGTITATQAGSLVRKLSSQSDSQYLVAEISPTDPSTLVSDLPDSNYNQLTITVGTAAGQSATAQQLNTIKNKTIENIRTGNITVITGNVSDMLTFVVDISSFVENNGTTARGESNYTFTPTSATQSASDLNVLNTYVTNISLENVYTISSSTLVQLGTLAANIGDNEFTNAKGLTTIAVSDATIDAAALASRIDSFDTINGGGTTNMILESDATINVDASEITEMLADETANRLTISTQDITVTNPITVDTANLLIATTGGVVTATIDATETLAELTTLSDSEGDTNNLTIAIREADATSATAEQLNTISNPTSIAVNLTNVTALAGSTLADLGTLATAINGGKFSNATGLTTIAVTDTTIDATILATTIDSYDTINDGATTGMTLASGATINVDADQVDHMLADETASRLTISNQKITVTNPISVDQANLLAATTSGKVTATIDPSERVSDLVTLVNPAGRGDEVNAWTIVINSDDATSATAAQLNIINSATDLTVNASNVTQLRSSLSDLLTLYTSSWISGLGDEYITITDTGSVAASSLTTLASANSSGTLNASAAATITGTAAEIIAAFADYTITKADDVALTVNSGTATQAQARSLNGLTTGVVTATIADNQGFNETVTTTSISLHCQTINIENFSDELNENNVETYLDNIKDNNSAMTAARCVLDTIFN